MTASQLQRASHELLDRIEANVPNDMLAERRWVAWDRTPRKDGRPSKTPLNPKTGRKAKSNDPQTWTSFAEARDAALRFEHAGGVGVVLTGGPWLALDLDHVINKSTGELAPGARALIDALTPTYIERSPGGDGLHVWFRGAKRAGWRSKVKDAFGTGTALEAYDGSGPRYLTVTGATWTDEPMPVVGATERDIDVLARLLAKEPSPSKASIWPRPTHHKSSGDDDLVRARWLLLDNGVLDHLLDDRDDWLRVLAALRPLGDDGRALAMEWSARSAKHDPERDPRTFDSLDGSSIGALFGMADDADKIWRDRYRDTLPPSGGAKQGSVEAAAEPIVQPTVASSAWPSSLSSQVRQSLVGEFLRLVESETEADPAAMVVDLLVRVGNAVGRGPHFEVGGDRHGCNLFACIVGDTGQGRKGTSAAYPRQAMQFADEEWSKARCLTGLSTGEGIIWAVRDPGPSGRADRNGEPIIDPGVEDKRLLVFESELARTLRAAGRKGSTLTAILRQGWEGARLAVMTKALPYSATDAHVSLLAHVTPTELQSLLSTDDLHGGTANRFLFVCSRRARELPFGGEIDSIAFGLFGKKLREAVKHGKNLGSVRFSALTREAWPDVYKRLLLDEQAQGLRGALLARAVVQVRRIAMIFAILDMSGTLDVQHLDAALEVWRYCRDSVSHLFGSATGNVVADRLLGELRGKPEGLDRTDMHKLFDRHVTAQAINDALQLLHEQQLASGTRTPTGGRPREVWRACELRRSEESEEGPRARTAAGGEGL